MSRRPRIATVITGLDRGGAETALLALLEATRTEYEHMVISLISGGALRSEFCRAGIPVMEVGVSGWLASAHRFAALRRAVSEFRPDVIATHMYHAALAATAVLRFAGPRAPLLWTVHHSLNELMSERRSTRLALRACRMMSGAPEAIIYVSKRSAEQHAAYGFRTDRSVVIPNGYNLEQFRRDGDARRQLRAEWGFSDDDIVVGHVGRVHPMKDHTNMIAAFRRASAQDPRLRAVFCGLGTDDLTLPDEIRPRVRVLGLRSDVPEVMSACDIGCLASSFGEAFPNVLAEFMSCERPCVTTDVGDAAEIVGEFGRVVPPRDAEALAHALLALARSRTELTRLGKAARTSIAERFSIAAVAARHAALWRQAMEAAAR